MEKYVTDCLGSQTRSQCWKKKRKKENSALYNLEAIVVGLGV